MKKIYHIKGLDCAHCAMEVEEAIRRLEGVRSVSINFVAMKMTLEAEAQDFARVYAEVKRVSRAVEPTVRFSEEKPETDGAERRELWLILTSAVLFALALVGEKLSLYEEGTLLCIAAFLPAYLLAGFPVLKKAVTGLFHGRVFDENFLMSLASLCAIGIGEAGEAVMVMILYRIGEYFQGCAVARSRKSIASLMEIRPDQATLLKDGAELTVSPEKVAVGDRILVLPGERIPLDGVVVEGSSFLDTAALTGESVPKAAEAGDVVLSGCINMNGPLTLRVEKEFGESTVSRILRLVEEAGDKKSQTEKIITRFARYYTPAVVILALLILAVPPLFGGDFNVWLHKAIGCLVISCPCALVISVPLSFFGGIGCASRHGVLIKGAESIEALSRLSTVAFDKTGTLTGGEFAVTAIHPDIIGEEELLGWATAGEHYSDHPISHSLKAAFRGRIDPARIGKVRELTGRGVEAVIDGKTVLVGNESLMEQYGVEVRPCEKCTHHGTVVHVAMDRTYLGHIVVSDRIRSDAKETLQSLKGLGITKTALLSGDRESVVAAVAAELGISEHHGGLLPEEKLDILSRLKAQLPQGRTLGYVGDGINDTPTLAAADVGIAMGGIGADAAMEASDVVLMEDKPAGVARAVRIARKTMGIVWQNILLSVGIKLVVLIPNLFFLNVPIALAVFSDVGVLFLAVLNATRALRTK